ncbi:MAG TPA: hypothetical protein VMD91_01230 [Candidatus Sulfotelmatobacter sp.]|nr:hypothetical protein [Candidatus Sulfotelmatobacter sp.]
MFDRAMWRYYLIATLLVLGAGSVLWGVHLAGVAASSARSSTTTAPVHAATTPVPGLEGGVRGPSAPPRPFVGEGGWVLSALPDCFDQQSSVEGDAAALAADIPPARERIAAGTILRRGPCTIHVRADDLWVERGQDRLRVPPSARLYRTPKGLVLVYEHAGNAQVRRY